MLFSCLFYNGSRQLFRSNIVPIGTCHRPCRRRAVSGSARLGQQHRRHRYPSTKRTLASAAPTSAFPSRHGVCQQTSKSHFLREGNKTKKKADLTKSRQHSFSSLRCSRSSRLAALANSTLCARRLAPSSTMRLILRLNLHISYNTLVITNVCTFLTFSKFSKNVCAFVCFQKRDAAAGIGYIET